MRARELILKPKKVTKAGDWKTGKMTRNAFPLSRTRNFILGVRWTWRVDVLEIDGIECRLLTAFEPAKHSFLAWLSYKRGSSCRRSTGVPRNRAGASLSRLMR
jgi:hypothetical protein